MPALLAHPVEGLARRIPRSDPGLLKALAMALAFAFALVVIALGAGCALDDAGPDPRTPVGYAAGAQPQPPSPSACSPSAQPQVVVRVDAPPAAAPHAYPHPRRCFFWRGRWIRTWRGWRWVRGHWRCRPR